MGKICTVLQNYDLLLTMSFHFYVNPYPIKIYQNWRTLPNKTAWSDFVLITFDSKVIMSPDHDS